VAKRICEEEKGGMSKQFPLCEYSENNEYFCLNCPYPTCAFDIEDQWRALLAKRKREEEQRRRTEEEKKVIDELLEVKWVQYRKYHPRGMGEKQYKANQRTALEYKMKRIDTG
jgi:hypothetical protein